MSAGELWKLIKLHDSNQDIMTTGSPSLYTDARQNENGIFYSHAYTLLKAVKLSTGDRLVKLRNPHGVDGYTGAWGDKSGKWTDDLAAEVGLDRDTDDGSFYMSIEDYKSQFEHLVVNIDPTDKHMAYFLRLDDDGSGARHGRYNWCGSTCTRHLLTVSSEVD
mmetsp:Transcript_30671/g.37950  ORF Transcript_30671/g.37950 Transcript_30671/m.37950 type:complete len:163 (-) Transcript_30671:906-1394(-)